jgi:hypothetical protein
MVATALAFVSLLSGQFQNPDMTTGVSYWIYASGARCAAKKSTQRIIRNELQLASYWTDTLGEDRQDVPQDIDFSQYTLVGIHLGNRETGGYSVDIQSVRREPGGDIRIKYVERKPAWNQPVIQMQSSPWVLLKLSGLVGDIKFQKVLEPVYTTPENPFPPTTRCTCTCQCCREGRCGCSGGVGELKR